MSYVKNYIIKPTIKDFYVPSFCRGCWIFDSTTNKIIDYSQYANHGANNGSINKGEVNVFDGLSSYVILPNKSSLDILSAPLAIFATIKIAESASAGYIIIKHIAAGTDQQYAIIYDPNNATGYGIINGIGANLEASWRAKSADNAIMTGVWYNVGFAWDGINVKVFVNRIQSGATGVYSGTLTSKPNIRIGKREGGTFLKGDIANVSVYASADINGILNHQKILSKNLI